MPGSSASSAETGPAVSVGVPVYNGERFLEAALESLVEQTFEHLEIIVCDNASTDGTGEIARSFASRDARVRYVRHDENLGAPRNYWSALRLARAPYFRWAAADDLSAPEYVERCVAVLDHDPGVVLAYPRTKFIDDTGEVFEEYEDGLHLPQESASERLRTLLENLGRCNAIFGLGRTEVFRACRPLGTFVGSDLTFLSELALRGCFHEVPDFLFFRRFHEGASSAMTEEDRRHFYDPNRNGAAQLRDWRHLAENLRSAMTVPNPVGERIRAVALLLRRAVRARDRLTRELTIAVRRGG